MARNPAPESDIVVPGGVIVIQPHGKSEHPLWFWLRSVSSVFWRGYFAAARLERDIVILDSARERQLYRDGPYNSITVTASLNRLVQEIQENGLDNVLRSLQVQESRIGPVQIEEIPSQSIRSWEPYVGKFRSIQKREHGAGGERSDP